MGIGTLLPTLLPSISTWLPLDLIQGHRWRSASGAIAIAPLDFWGKQELYQSTLGLLALKPQNIPKLFLGIFGDKTQKNPNFQTNLIPKISLNYFRGFLGIKPQKTPIFNPTPSPKNPQCFFIPCPHPRPVPENSGTGRGKPGIGAPFPTTSIYCHLCTWLWEHSFGFLGVS